MAYACVRACVYVCVTYLNLHDQDVLYHMSRVLCTNVSVKRVCVMVCVCMCVCARTVLPTNGTRVELQQCRVKKKLGVELFNGKKRKKEKERKRKQTRNNGFEIFCAQKKTITITVHRVETSNTRRRNFR